LLVNEALDYGLACSETAFIAVRQEKGKPVEASVAVGNALPAGWSESFLSGQSYGRSPAVLLAAGAAPQFMREKTTKAFRLKKAKVGRLQSLAALQVEEVAQPQIKTKVMFSDVPQFTEGQAILFDSSRPEDEKKLPEAINISTLEIRFPAGAPSPENVDASLSLLIFVDDLAVPRAKVRLVDLIRQRLKRPLHLSRQAGEVVRIVLVDPNGAWQQSAPKIEVLLEG
jgi:hypothetical protein